MNSVKTKNIVTLSVKMTHGEVTGRYVLATTRIVSSSTGELISVGDTVRHGFETKERMYKTLLNKEPHYNAIHFSETNALTEGYHTFKYDLNKEIEEKFLTDLKEGFQKTTTIESGMGVFESTSLLLTNAYKAEQVLDRYKSGFHQKEFILRLEEKSVSRHRNHIDYHFSLEDAKRIANHLNTAIEALEKAKESF